MTDDLDLPFTAQEIFARGERRLCRSESGTIADGFTRLRNDLAFEFAEKTHYRDQVDDLIQENLKLRAALDRVRSGQ